MPTVNQSIRAFLEAQLPRHNGPDLLRRILIHFPGLEVQVKVAADSGEPVDGKRSTYTDGVNEWFNIRTPKKADSQPEWHDYELQWPLDLHAEAIGCTGWEWTTRRSLWVAFDVDSLIGHAKGVGLTDEELEKVKSMACDLPYVEVRRSTGGTGLHLYVYLDRIPTENHTVHAALARAVLGMMSSTTGFDFASQIDACGGNMWVWHRKMTAENHGLEIIKSATQTLSSSDLPANWHDHLAVVTRQRAKVLIANLPAEDIDPFESLASSRRLVPLDAMHKAIIEELGRSGFSTVWVPDFHLLQTHTHALQALIDNPEHRTSLKLKGFFRTNSKGRDPATPNCFCFPAEDGAWRVYRFSPGVDEADMWEQDGVGWTTCDFNKAANLSTAAKAGGGTEAPNNGGYVFPTAVEAGEVVEVLGQKLDIPEHLQQRETRLKTQRDGRIVFSITKENKEEVAPPGWINDGKKLTRVLKVKSEVQAQANEESYAEHDKIARFVVTPAGRSAGWYGRAQNGVWVDGNKDDMRGLLLREGKSKPEVDVIIADIWARHWKLVNLPFQPEYPGDRQWNLDAAQYKVKPADAEGPHPHWDMILQHCFCDLDGPLKEMPWAQRANIRTGADYGLLWSACLLREPFCPLPYLFLYGDENCGKSIFHESFAILVTKGLVSANNALQNQNGFNGELATAILAYVEEIDISHTPGALAKIKEWVLSPTFPVRKMRTDTYAIPNTLHFVQTSNYPEYCPIFPGDTRITMAHVAPLEIEIPRRKMDDYLKEEAPAFLRTLLDLPLPSADGRLRIPVVETHNKVAAQDLRRTPVEQFIAEHCHAIPGSRIPFSDFCERFRAQLPDEEGVKWSKPRIARALPSKHPAGSHTGNVKYVVNLSWDPETPTEPWVVVDGRLTR
jgi:hypothetical protein